MERLTFEGNFCDIAQCRDSACQQSGTCTQRLVWERLKQFEDAVQTPKKAAWAKKTIEMAFSDDMSEVERLRELYKADKDGRVVVLPCKVGDVLYAAESAPVIPLHVMEVAIYLALEGEDGGDYERISNIGKTVFLTREEAEKALQEMEGKKDGNKTSM